MRPTSVFYGAGFAKTIAPPHGPRVAGPVLRYIPLLWADTVTQLKFLLIASPQTLPRLVTLAAGNRLQFAPYPTLTTLRGTATSLLNINVTPTRQILSSLAGVQYEMQLSFSLSAGQSLTLRVLADPTGQEYTDIVASAQSPL